MKVIIIIYFHYSNELATVLFLFTRGDHLDD